MSDADGKRLSARQLSSRCRQTALPHVTTFPHDVGRQHCSTQHFPHEVGGGQHWSTSMPPRFLTKSAAVSTGVPPCRRVSSRSRRRSALQHLHAAAFPHEVGGGQHCSTSMPPRFLTKSAAVSTGAPPCRHVSSRSRRRSALQHLHAATFPHDTDGARQHVRNALAEDDGHRVAVHLRHDSVIATGEYHQPSRRCDTPHNAQTRNTTRMCATQN